jgi:hypothetical protein
MSMVLRQKVPSCARDPRSQPSISGRPGEAKTRRNYSAIAKGATSVFFAISVGSGLPPKNDLAALRQRLIYNNNPLICRYFTLN